MKADALRKSLAPPPQGVYPFVELRPHLGYPSLADFEIISNDQGTPMAAAALREFPRISRIAGYRGICCPVVAGIPDNWPEIFMSMTRISVGCCATLATRTYFST